MKGLFCIRQNLRYYKFIADLHKRIKPNFINHNCYLLARKLSEMEQFQITSKTVQSLSSTDVIVKEAKGPNAEKYFARILQLQRIEEFGIKENFSFTRSVLKDLSQMPFRAHLVCMEQEIISENSVAIIVKPYSCTLQQYIQHNKINEKGALKIFDQILKAIYSIWTQGNITRNLRPEHFVLSDNNWRLQTLICAHEFANMTGTESEYRWSSKHQAPECIYRSIFCEEEYPSMLVWNLGCVLLQMLANDHKLSTRQAMKQLKDKPFSFKALEIHGYVWAGLSSYFSRSLARMLSYDPKDRMTLRQLFSDSFFSPEVAKHFNQKSFENKHEVGLLKPKNNRFRDRKNQKKEAAEQNPQDYRLQNLKLKQQLQKKQEELRISQASLKIKEEQSIKKDSEIQKHKNSTKQFYFSLAIMEKEKEKVNQQRVEALQKNQQLKHKVSQLQARLHHAQRLRDKPSLCQNCTTLTQQLADAHKKLAELKSSGMNDIERQIKQRRSRHHSMRKSLRKMYDQQQFQQ